MSITHLAFRNTRRRPGRSLLTTLAIALAVAAATFMDAYVEGAVNGFFESYVRIEAGHVKIMPEAAVDRVRMLSLDQGLTGVDSLLHVIESIPAVKQASPRIRFGVLLDGPDGAIPAYGTAVTPSRERGLIELDDWVSEGRVPADDADELLIGYELAKKLELNVGDELFFVASTSYGGLGPGVYTVTGTFRSGISQLDRRAFYVPLAPAQYQLAMEDRALNITLMIDGGMEAAIPVAAQIQQAIDEAGFEHIKAVPWQQQGSMYEMMAPARVFTVVLMGLLGIIALVTVVNTVLMSVMERTREIGALRAMGFDRRTVIRLVMTESALVGVVGTILGLIIGMAVSIWLGRVGIDFSEIVKTMDLPMNTVFYPEPSLVTAIKASLLGLVIAVLAAWYPARVAARLEPAKALRSV
ncbi:ABC transporter permease [bacterium]|nr:ABC transporter permease [bacterium]